jgi:uncharacterized protein
VEEFIKKEIAYFFNPGPQNTEPTLRVAKERARELGISTVTIASDTGFAAKIAADILLPDIRLAVVTNPKGGHYKVSRLWKCYPHSKELRESFEKKGVASFPYSLSDEIAQDLSRRGAVVLYIDWKKMKEGNRYHRRFLWPLITISQGFRVAYLSAMFAQLEGVISGSDEVISIGGTGHCGGGLDTALVMRPGRRFFEWEVREIIAMPRSCSKFGWPAE